MFLTERAALPVARSHRRYSAIAFSDLLARLRTGLHPAGLANDTQNDFTASAESLRAITAATCPPAQFRPISNAATSSNGVIGVAVTIGGIELPLVRRAAALTLQPVIQVEVADLCGVGPKKTAGCFQAEG